MLTKQDFEHLVTSSCATVVVNSVIRAIANPGAVIFTSVERKFPIVLAQYVKELDMLVEFVPKSEYKNMLFTRIGMQEVFRTVKEYQTEHEIEIKHYDIWLPAHFDKGKYVGVKWVGESQGPTFEAACKLLSTVDKAFHMAYNRETGLYLGLELYPYERLAEEDENLVEIGVLRTHIENMARAEDSE